MILDHSVLVLVGERNQAYLVGTTFCPSTTNNDIIIIKTIGSTGVLEVTPKDYSSSGVNFPNFYVQRFVLSIQIYRFAVTNCCNLFFFASF